MLCYHGPHWGGAVRLVLCIHCYAGDCGACKDCLNCEVLDCPDNGSDPSHMLQCNLLGLPDLNHSHPFVQDSVAGYLSQLVDLGVVGIRVDAAKHIEPKDLDAILSKVGGVHAREGNCGRPLLQCTTWQARCSSCLSCLGHGMFCCGTAVVFAVVFAVVCCRICFGISLMSSTTAAAQPVLPD